MCGRFTITVSARALRERYDLGEDDGALFEPQYNASPGLDLPVILEDKSGNLLSMARWGIRPPWNTPGTKVLINARGETVGKKYPFRDLVKSRRCIIPVDGFYEWSAGKMKIPWRFVMKDGSVFSLAGLWDETTDADTGRSYRTFLIITTSPNETVKPVHDRMPCILPAKFEKRWIREGLDLEDLLRPYPGGEMKGYTVGSDVNRTGINSPHLIEPQEKSLFPG